MDLQALSAYHLPDSIVDFYRDFDPKRVVELQVDVPVRLYPIKGVIEQNRGYEPGVHVAPVGYIAFATTIYGDAYCFDLTRISEGRCPVVLLTHEIGFGGATAEEVAPYAKQVAEDFTDFLRKFIHDELDKEPIDDPDSA